MKQSLALHVRGSPDHSNAHWTAIKLAKAWVIQGHCLHSIFFSGAAAVIAHSSRVVDSGRGINLQQAWQSLGCPLVICVNAARHCGIVSDPNAQTGNPPFNTLAAHYCIGGLGSLAEAKQLASKFIEFVY